MVFHASCGFDFQKWLAGGIGMCTSEVEESLMQQVRMEVGDRNKAVPWGQEPVQLDRQEDKTWFANLWETVLRPFMEGEEGCFENGGRSATVAANGANSKKASELVLPFMNPFRAKYVRQQLEKQYPQCYVENRPTDTAGAPGGAPSTATPGARVLHRSLTATEKARLEEEKARRDETRNVERRKYFRERVGFRHVWSLLKASCKPIVLHNGFFDLMFLFHNLEMELPESLAEFKREWSKRICNVIFDTKIPSAGHLREKYGETKLPFSSLEESCKLMDATYPELEKEVHVAKPASATKEGEKAAEVEKYHDAAFDATVTARLFLALTEKEKVTLEKNVVPADGGRNLFRLCLGIMGDEEDKLIESLGACVVRILTQVAGLGDGCNVDLNTLRGFVLAHAGGGSGASAAQRAAANGIAASDKVEKTSTAAPAGEAEKEKRTSGEGVSIDSPQAKAVAAAMSDLRWINETTVFLLFDLTEDGQGKHIGGEQGLDSVLSTVSESARHSGKVFQPLSLKSFLQRGGDSAELVKIFPIDKSTPMYGGRKRMRAPEVAGENLLFYPAARGEDSQPATKKLKTG
eukprot:g3971.t1